MFLCSVSFVACTLVERVQNIVPIDSKIEATTRRLRGRRRRKQKEQMGDEAPKSLWEYDMPDETTTTITRAAIVATYF